MSLQGKVALVTGASRGIGQAIALELGRQGAVVIGTFWFQLNEINAGSSRPKGFAPYVTRKVGVLVDYGEPHIRAGCVQLADGYT